MRWVVVFVVVSVLAVAMQTSLVEWLLTLDSLGGIWPSLVGVVLVFVAIFAPRPAVLWAAWGLGLFYDLSLAQPQGVQIGPHALGYVFGAYLILQLRTMVFRRHLITISLMTAMFLAASGVVEVALLTVRLMFGDASLAAAEFRPVIEMLKRFGIAIYSALAAFPIGWILIKSLSLWAFPQVSGRRRR